MQTPELVAIVAVAISAASAILAFKQSKYNDRNWEIRQENRITNLEASLLRMSPVNDRVVALETKMGVFWNMVEHLSVSQLLHTTPQNIADATIYDSMRSKTPTPIMKRLGEYLVDRLYDLDTTPDEKVLIVLKLGAIQAQLIDRGEEPISYGI